MRDGCWSRSSANRLLHDIDVALEEEAETVAELLGTPAEPGRGHQSARADRRRDRSGPRKYVVVTRDGQVIAEAPRRRARGAARPASRRCASCATESPDRAVTVSIGVSAAAALHAKQRLTLAPRDRHSAMLLLLAGTSLWVVIGRALRPLENASRQLEQIAAETCRSASRSRTPTTRSAAW